MLACLIHKFGSIDDVRRIRGEVCYLSERKDVLDVQEKEDLMVQLHRESKGVGSRIFIWMHDGASPVLLGLVAKIGWRELPKYSQSVVGVGT